MQAFLVLENGRVFTGQRFGADGDPVGELVFTTAMTGYLETLTDPSYFGQIVIQTFPLIGNYGVIPSDFESKTPALKAYIVHEWCQEPSNFRSQGALDAFLKSSGVVGLSGIDTRALTRIVREHGVMNAKIMTENPNLSKVIPELKAHKIAEPVKGVTTKEPYTIKYDDSKYHVVLWDFGAKASIAKELAARGCEVTVVPAGTTAEQIMALHPDGIMLSNGPGDPGVNTGIVKQLRELNKKKLPTFGICLGHQLMALACGGKSIKLKYGHRGENQPALQTEPLPGRTDSGRVFITGQNHGYAIESESLPDNMKVSFVNMNDRTCEGLIYNDLPAFTVQFHPEASGGPLDTMFMFDHFISMMGGK